MTGDGRLNSWKPQGKMVACSLSFFLFASALALLVAKKLFWESRLPSLRGRHVLVTGGSSGIGKATAIEASKLGASVTILGRDQGKLENALEEIKMAAKHPEEQKTQCLALDVTKGLVAAEEAVERAEETAGPVFLLVNCVGVATCSEFEEVTESDFRRMMDVNFFGTVFPSISTAKRMKRRQEGHIVVTASQAALLGFFGTAALSPSKFALRGFAESLSMELKPHNVSVTLCFPPDTDTPGFFAEQRSKPPGTRLVSCPAELFGAGEVARRLLADALGKKFVSSLGLESLVLTTLCACMSPAASVTDAVLQVSLMGLLRMVSLGYLLHFQRAIARATKSGNHAQKIE